MAPAHSERSACTPPPLAGVRTGEAATVGQRGTAPLSVTGWTPEPLQGQGCGEWDNGLQGDPDT